MKNGYIDHTTKCCRQLGLCREPINSLKCFGQIPQTYHRNNTCWHILTLSSFLFPSVDVNDNVPFFTSSIYEASVTEGADSGTFVFQVSANDLDLGLNGKVKTHSHMHTHIG